tara:strand:- start:1981 stop:2643 length:663 start_codon:yes stop_codon:yes gene_type:complete
MNYPQFKEFQDYFNTSGNLKTMKTNDDDRINSLLDEEHNLLNASKVFHDLEIYPPRKFADFKLKNRRNCYPYNPFNPFNWKSTTTTTADNCSAKLSILYSFCGVDEEDLPKYQQWQKFWAKVNEFKDYTAEQFEKIYRPYYFLIQNKKTNKVFINELSTLTKLTPNGNNLPFQIKWNDNSTVNTQDKRSAFIQLLTALHESVTLFEQAHAGRHEVINAFK